MKNDNLFVRIKLLSVQTITKKPNSVLNCR